MKNKFYYLIKHPLISGSGILIFGSMIANVLNYLFNLGMGRLMTVSDYGTFAALVSIFNIFSVLSISINTVFAKFSASYVGKKQENLVGGLFVKGSLWIGLVSLFICLGLIIFSENISNFLNIDNEFLVIITSAALFFSFLTGIGLGVLQGLLKFIYISAANILSSFFKLFLGILFVLMGWKVFGAILAFFLAAFIGYLFIFIPLYKYINNRVSDNSIRNLHKNLFYYGTPVFLSTIGVTAFITMDIILIKHYFSPEVAGHYAALSLMGRSIFYVVSPVSLVLFPLIAQKKERKEKLLGTLSLSVLLIGIPSIFLSLIYFTIPEFVISVFFPGSEYQVVVHLMGPYSVFILFYSLSFLMSNFYLSIGKIKVFLLTIAAAALEIIYIVMFHENIDQIVNGLVFITFLLLCALLLSYRRATKSLYN